MRVFHALRIRWLVLLLVLPSLGVLVPLHGPAAEAPAGPSRAYLPLLARDAPIATPWFLTRGGTTTDKAWGVDTDALGNVYLATYETAPGTLSDIYLYKFDANGKQLWKSAPWGRAGNDQSYVVVVNEPHVYVAGRSDTSFDVNSADMAVLAYNMTDGSLAWSWIGEPGSGYDETDGLVITPDGIYIAGWRTMPGMSNDIAVGKLSLDGQLLWMKTWGTAGWDEANGQIVVTASTIYVAGKYNGPPALLGLLGGQAALVAFDRTDGEYLWHTKWGAAGSDAYGMIGDASGLYVVGVDFQLLNGQIFVRKYTAAGDLAWDRMWGGSKGEATRAVEVADDGAVIVAGKTDSYGAGMNDIVVIRYSPDGTEQWSRLWGGAKSDETHGLALHGDTLYIAGETSSYGAGASDALLLSGTLSTATLGTVKVP
ncbi:MAG: hypothetical protein HY875_16950 [Chloroflexi bacterium]|nr:hypothetical protein [Chloroflexota bacterium]